MKDVELIRWYHAIGGALDWIKNHWNTPNNHCPRSFSNASGVARERGGGPLETFFGGYEASPNFGDVSTNFRPLEGIEGVNFVRK